MLIFEIPYIKNNIKVNRSFLIIGSLLPDIVDKTIMFLNLGSGRGYFHTLLAILFAFLLVYLITKGNKEVSFSFLTGMGLHLVLDLPYIPIFYPFVPYEFIIVEDPLGIWLERLLTDPLIYISESIGILILIYIVINNKLYSIIDVIDFLKTTTYIYQKRFRKISSIRNNF